MRKTLEERFWEKVDKSAGPDGCWLWNGERDEFGHGRIMARGKHTNAHRVAWSLTNGEITGGMWCLHMCDNPSCVNPAHLFLGTAQDNSRDMVDKGRHIFHVHPERAARGERGPTHKLTTEQVREIRATYAAGGISTLKLAARYGVAKQSIACIIHHKTWRHVTP